MPIPQSPSMLTRRVGSVLLLVQGAESPTEAEWSECLDVLRPFVDSARVLVVTDGGGPNPSQRRRLSELIDGNPMRAAIVTDSIKVRFIVSSVALFIQRIRSFAMNEMAAAFRHLDLNSVEIEQITQAIEDMRPHVGSRMSTSRTPRRAIR
jgi:hypothetical protein